jgi:hypothetical protein
MARLESLSTTTNSSSTDTSNSVEPSTESAAIDATETAAPPSEKRKPLVFDPEPTQRMVVVRRRKRRRSQKVSKADQAAARVRFVLLGLVVILLLVAVSGQHFAQALLEQLKEIARPVKGLLHAPKLEIVALVIAALILIYMMPGVESTVKRWLGIKSRTKQNPR